MAQPKVSDPPDIHRLVDLHKFLLEFQAIERHVCYIDQNCERSENDAEHSFSLAMTAWFLAGFFPKLDSNKVIRYALAHDLLEVHAGDTSVFADAKTLASKPAREAKAVEQLDKDWPDFPDFIRAIKAYENRDDEEAKFVYALDKIMPIILNYINKGYSWRKHKISLDQLHDTKKDKVKTSAVIAKYYDQLYDILLKNPDYFHPNPA